MAYGNPNPGSSDMPMDDMPMAEANEPPHDEAAEASEATTTIPAELTGGQTFKPGDEIVLEVVNANEDGSLEVKYATPKGKEGTEGESWEDDFRKSMSPQEPQQEAY